MVGECDNSIIFLLLSCKYLIFMCLVFCLSVNNYAQILHTLFLRQNLCPIFTYIFLLYRY
jgi:hypothetical protein